MAEEVENPSVMFLGISFISILALKFTKNMNKHQVQNNETDQEQADATKRLDDTMDEIGIETLEKDHTKIVEIMLNQNINRTEAIRIIYDQENTDTNEYLEL